MTRLPARLLDWRTTWQRRRILRRSSGWRRGRGWRSSRWAIARARGRRSAHCRRSSRARPRQGGPWSSTSRRCCQATPSCCRGPRCWIRSVSFFARRRHRSRSYKKRWRGSAPTQRHTSSLTGRPHPRPTWPRCFRPPARDLHVSRGGLPPDVRRAGRLGEGARRGSSDRRDRRRGDGRRPVRAPGVAMSVLLGARAGGWRAGDWYAARTRRASIVLGGLALALALAYAIAIVASEGDPWLVLPLIALVIVLGICAHPVAGVFLVFATVILFEQFSIPFLSPITADTHIYENLSEYTPIPLRLSIVDLLLLLTLASWAARRFRAQRAVFRMGAFGWAIALYGAVFVIGMAIGALRGSWDPVAALAELPRRGLVLGAVVALLLGGYILAFGQDSGPLGEPIRAVRSVADPSAVSVRDQLSTAWRDIEDRNIEYTMRQLPLTGVGLGQQYLFQEEPPKLWGFTYWRYTTHNAVLWLWLKAGPLGGFALWFLVARVLIVGSHLFVGLRDPWLRWMATLPVLLVLVQLVFSSVELGLTYSRTMICLGTVLGLGAVVFELGRPALASAPAPSRGGSIVARGQARNLRPYARAR